MTEAAEQVLAIPPNVDPALVVDFDYLKPAGIEDGDVFAAFGRLHDGPDICWSPHYGGHWIATRGEDIQWIQERHELFSNAEKNLPKGSFPSMPPITENPPDHTRYRAVLNPYFARRHIEANYETKARAVIGSLIDEVMPRGSLRIRRRLCPNCAAQDFLGLRRPALCSGATTSCAGAGTS